uniref:Uncharacterized protein n=1 Tax=viral metagenome TaxID=1070528 RepID=A0A6C0E8S2_9ZZZZ
MFVKFVTIMRKLDVNVSFKYGYGLIIEFAKAPPELRKLMNKYRQGGCFCHGLDNFLRKHIGINGTYNPAGDLANLDCGSCDKGDEYTPLFYYKKELIDQSFNMVLDFELDNYIKPYDGIELKKIKKQRLSRSPEDINFEYRTTELSNHIIITEDQEANINRLILEKIKQVDPEYGRDKIPSYCVDLDMLQKIHDWFFDHGVDYKIGWCYEYNICHDWHCQSCSQHLSNKLEHVWELSEEVLYKKYYGKMCADCDWIYCYKCLTSDKIKRHTRKYPNHTIVKYKYTGHTYNFFLTKKAYQEFIMCCSDEENESEENKSEENESEEN